MKRFTLLLAFCLVIDAAWGQSKAVFRMPERAKPNDYHRSRVMAKIKPDHLALFQASQSGRMANPLPSSAGALSINRLINDNLLAKGKTLQGPRVNTSKIDLERFVSVSCAPGTDVEKFINALYATGHFEIVEPDYIPRRLVTPNDPDISKQYYLTNIKAFEGWDLATGSTNVVIAIVDSGGDMDHPDLKDNYWVNPNEIPNNNIDDDNNGHIDDINGWDFMGADTLNININPFVGDNNLNITLVDNNHGVIVAGCASGRVNNSAGIAGVGFNAKLMITKHSADNQPAENPGVYRAYEGILYAAANGAKVINTSWGGEFSSQIAQDIVNQATAMGSLIVAAAGNSGSSTPIYPASYDNVLSVAATDKNNKRATFSSIGYTVDISAPGLDIYSTNFNNTYVKESGTSFSAPIVSGAAALVFGNNPTFTPQQVAEQLRVSSDAYTLYNANPNLALNLGFGLLDIRNALSLSSPSIRAAKPKLLNAQGTAAELGQLAFLTFSFTNYLQSTSSGIHISLVSGSPFLQFTKSSISPGIIGSNSTITNTVTPFELTVAANTPENTKADLLITYEDGAYSDTQVFSFILNPSFIDVNQNLISTTISGIGRIGYEDPEADTRVKGSGFVFDNNSLLYEMGLIMGTSSTNLFNNVRGIDSGFDQDFVSTTKIKQIIPGDVSASEIFGTFSNSASPALQKVQVSYKSYVWKDSLYDKFVILEYLITNPTAAPLNGFHFGLFADWDITANGQQDAANWDLTNNMGYVYPATTAAKPHAGIQLLVGSPEYYAIDNDQNIAGSNVGLYDGFTDTEKFKTISNGQTKKTAGAGPGNDVSHVVSSGPHNIPAGQQIKVVFVLHAAANLNDLKQSARYADTVYNYRLNAPRPTVSSETICYGGTTSLTASGATQLNWYKAFTGGKPFHTGTTLNTAAVYNDTTFYVSNAEESYESVRTPGKITVKANPTISTSGSPTFCDGESIILSVADADTYAWSTGASTKTITVNTADTFTVTVTDMGLGCSSVSDPVVTVVNTVPQAQFSINSTGTLVTGVPVEFLNESVDAATSFWDFGDGFGSFDTNPSHTYTKSDDSYTIKLIVNSAGGCQDNTTQGISVITALDEARLGNTLVYPNPFKSEFYLPSDPGDPVLSIRISDLLGKTLYETDMTPASGASAVSAAAMLPDGLYLIWLKYKDRVVSQKVIKGNN